MKPQIVSGAEINQINSFSLKASRRKALRAAMMEEFKVAEEAREANVRLNQLSQEEVKASFDICGET